MVLVGVLEIVVVVLKGKKEKKGNSGGVALGSGSSFLSTG